MKISNANSYEIAKCEVIEEGGQFYLSITCRCENESQVSLIDIPRVILPLDKHSPLEVTWENSYHRYAVPERVRLHLGDHDFYLKSHCGKYFTETVVEEKIHELTLDEIEKKLGYKVKIVSGGKK